MFTKTNVLFLFLCCSILRLAAQPGGDIIDLGGEDTTVGPLKPPPISQIAEPAAWLTSLLRGDSLRFTPGGMLAGPPYFLEVSSNPGPISAYQEMNIFVFLEDQRAFQDYFMHRVYQNSFSTSRSGARSRTRSSMQQGRQTAPQSRSATRSQNRISTADGSDRTNLRTYPLVRQYAFGQRSLTNNPNYQSKSASNNGTIDAAYVDGFNRFANLIDLYQKALIDPATEKESKHPGTLPTYFFDASRKVLNYEMVAAYDKMELAVKAKMTQEYSQMHREAWRSPTFRAAPWSDSDLATVTAKLAVTPLSSEQQLLIKTTMAKLAREFRSVSVRHNDLVSAYGKHMNLLNEQEKIWFKWVLVNALEIRKNLSVTTSYLKQISDAPLSETNYSQLVTASNLLREAHQRIANLPDEAKAREVLINITNNYFNQVEASKVAYQQKRNE